MLIVGSSNFPFMALRTGDDTVRRWRVFTECGSVEFRGTSSVT
ncbi:hypothetical protein PAECIP112173_04602 [Paenibacillus sp. JJ-100]|nr:hypothetical protein PAECIP112173_04602 [Paenibacillus sp. JJ-100]